MFVHVLYCFAAGSCLPAQHHPQEELTRDVLMAELQAQRLRNFQLVQYVCVGEESLVLTRGRQLQAAEKSTVPVSSEQPASRTKGKGRLRRFDSTPEEITLKY